MGVFFLIGPIWAHAQVASPELDRTGGSRDWLLQPSSGFECRREDQELLRRPHENLSLQADIKKMKEQVQAFVRCIDSNRLVESHPYSFLRNVLMELLPFLVLSPDSVFKLRRVQLDSALSRVQTALTQVESGWMPSEALLIGRQLRLRLNRITSEAEEQSQEGMASLTSLGSEVVYVKSLVESFQRQFGAFRKLACQWRSAIEKQRLQSGRKDAGPTLPSQVFLCSP